MDQHAARRGVADTPIALVGMGALFPGATNTGGFWSNIVDGVDSITEVPQTHWSVDDYYDPDPSVPDKTYCRRGGFLPTIGFDPVEFGIPPNTLEVTDILQLLSLTVARDTLADAGAESASWYDPSRTGVVLGVTGANSLTQPLATRLQTPVLKEVVRSVGLSDADGEEISRRFASAFAPWEENSFPGMLGNVVAGRIANRFDLGGMNCTVDAACASSLAAVNAAIGELVSGRADMMLSGGVDAENTIFMYLCFSKTPAFSASNVIRPFDRNSDGTLIGEGLGMLALKRLEDAEHDGDRIYAVLRGMGASSDGRFKSIYAPRASGQQLALRRAYAESGVGPEHIGLLECHGTGTAVGDRTELEALTEVYGDAGVREGSIAVGSIKSQIGHTKAAAGAASLIKMALSLHHKVLPPTINVSEPAEIFAGSPFHLATEARPWVADPAHQRRRAAVSSFGFGGTNFHCVLEEYDSDGAQPCHHRDQEIRVWHAADAECLLAAVDADAEGADPHDPIPPGHARLAVIGVDADDRAAKLSTAVDRLRQHPGIEEFDLPSGAFYRRDAADLGRVGLLCAGQGSQYPGMGRSAALAIAAVREAFDEAAHHVGEQSLGRIVFPGTAFDAATAEEQARVLRRTENAQPAIAALSAGHLRYLLSLGLRPEGALGHSFGELTALWAAGSISDGRFFELARSRGQAMADAAADDPGTMLSVHADADRVARLLTGHDDVVLCNRNAPQQTVVGGGTQAVAAFAAEAEEAGLRVQPLPVSAAFHTSHVSAAVDAFRASVRQVRVCRPGFAVYANTSGAEYGGDEERNADILSEQLACPVDFAGRVRQMYAEGFRTFVEIGPKKVLSGLVRHTLGDDVHTVALDQGPGTDSDTTVKRAVAKLLVLGVPLTEVNRYTAATVPESPSKRMAIPLNGVNHVPEKRREEYRAALETEYELSISRANNGHVPTSQPESPTPRPPALSSGHAETARDIAEQRGNAVTETQPYNRDQIFPEYQAIDEHLATHEQFLRGQLGIADRLAGLLERHSANGAIDAHLAAGIQSITDHSVSVSNSHARANEVLGSLAELSTGGRARVPRQAEDAPVAPQRTPIQESGHTNGNTVRSSAALSTTHTVPSPEPLSEQHNGNGPVAAPEPIEFELAPQAPHPTAAPTPAAPPVDNGSSAVAEGKDPARVVLDLVADKTGYPADMLDIDMDMESDLGIDSIKRVEILSGLREQLPDPGAVEPPDPAQMRSLRDVVGFIDSSAQGVVQAPKAREGASGIVVADVRPVVLSRPEKLEAPFTRRCAVLVGGGEAAAEFASRLNESGWRVTTAPDPVVARDMCADTDLVVLFVPDAEDALRARESLRDGLLLAGAAQPTLVTAAREGRAAFLAVTRLDGATGLDGRSPAIGRARPELLGGFGGMVKTLAVEAPELLCRHVDLHPDLSSVHCARTLLEELHDPDVTECEVGRRPDGARWAPRVREPEAPLPSPGRPPGTDDVFVVTGGGRGVTAACAVGLAREYRTGLLLLGRTELVDEPAHLVEVADEDLRRGLIESDRESGIRRTPKEIEREVQHLLACREIRRTVRLARAAGSEVHYRTVDVTDPVATANVLAPWRDRVTGLVHGAGILADQFIVDKTAESVDRVLAAKLAGFDAVLGAVDVAKLRHVATFSSVAALYGNRGQSDYAAANAALDRAVVALRARYPHVSAHSLVWGAWEGGMVTPALARMFADRGVSLIPLDEGVRHFVEHFVPGPPRAVVRFIGVPQPLSVPDTAWSADRDRTLVREISELPEDPVIQAHVISGEPVLPLTAVIGTVLRVAENALATQPWQVRSLRVLKGVVLDASAPSRLLIQVNQDGETVRMKLSDPDERPRYSASLDLVEPYREPETVELPDLDQTEPAFSPYEFGTLFHGKVLRGIHGLVPDENRTVLRCHLMDIEALEEWRVPSFNPVLADLLLQAALVWARRTHQAGVLPVAVATVEVHDSLPEAEEFVVIVDPGADRGPTKTCTVTACSPDGRVLLRMNDIEVVVLDSFTKGF